MQTHTKMPDINKAIQCGAFVNESERIAAHKLEQALRKAKREFTLSFNKFSTLMS
jgi:hypothetical protein